MNTRYSEQDKINYVDKFLKSNQSLKEFAQKHRIGDKSLARWVDRYSTPLNFCESNSVLALKSSMRGLVTLQIPYKDFIEIIQYKSKYEELYKQHEQVVIELHRLKNA